MLQKQRECKTRRSATVWISVKTTKIFNLSKNQKNCLKIAKHTIIKICIPTQTPYFCQFVDKTRVVHEKTQNIVDKYLSKPDKIAKIKQKTGKNTLKCG